MKHHNQNQSVLKENIHKTIEGNQSCKPNEMKQKKTGLKSRDNNSSIRTTAQVSREQRNKRRRQSTVRNNIILNLFSYDVSMLG